MKKCFITAILASIFSLAMAQDNTYWVFFTDKNGTSFDPYSYFDAKAIARYEQCGADLFDISNYPLNSTYVNTVSDYCSEILGESRWLNALGVDATAENAALIAQLPFVAHVQQISSDWVEASVVTTDEEVEYEPEDILTDQVKRFGGEYFLAKGIDGTGMRICVLDGGFPKVDTHPAFKHLRDDNRIIATYNFPNKKEDVYGWSSHGTMVLSCIAGIDENGQKLGLATGAEFLLARTEIDPEPFKEEIWWEMGAEWADKNGANVINSSLGYGKERYWTRDMDGQSYVAKAANLAVEKGILICCSAGNEGDDKHWMTIVTPSDAENVICVGGIEPKLNDYRHISFSSYGPSADGRMKPNVVAFGHAKVANPSYLKNKNYPAYAEAYGTSFASPLTAGFAACAWQTRPELTALQMKAEIEKSCDLYPYFDYAFGYGVPQAAYFTGDLKESEPLFNLVQEKDGVRIAFKEVIKDQYVFISVEDDNGVLLGYYQTEPKVNGIILKNTDLGQGKKLNVSYNGCYATCPVSGNGEEICLLTDEKTSHNGTMPNIRHENWQTSFYLRDDIIFPTDTWNVSNHFTLGLRWLYGKGYKLGFGFGLDFNNFIAKDSIPEVTYVNSRRTTMKNTQLSLELMQRVEIIRNGLMWDLGIYGGINCTRTTRLVEKVKWYDENGNQTHPYNEKVITNLRGCKNMNLFEYGINTRLYYTFLGQINLGVSGTYRLSDVITKKDPILGLPDNNPSPWSAGIELELLF
ncbi:MAG: S8 family serine peptidase [Bacteroidales bacterium]|nr:S8 family serine peptidase [Bacteroidales bacterium]